MKYNGVIQRKLALLDHYLMELSPRVGDLTAEAFRSDWVLQRMAERSLQVMIEICIDVAERILAIEGAGPVATSAEAFRALEQLGIVQSARPYEEMAGFRNRIVHQYQDVDPDAVYSVLSTRLSDFRRFRDEIDQAGA